MRPSNYCPNCGFKKENIKFKEKHGIASETSGWGSCSFLECSNCKYQFNLRTPITGDYKPKYIEDFKPREKLKPMGRHASRKHKRNRKL